MLGRKLSTVAIVALLGAVGAIGACRDDATTGPSDIPSKDLATNIRLQAGDFQTGSVALPLPQQLRVRVVDAGGKPVSGADVTWAVLAGGGSVNPATGISDANGNVSTTWTLGATLGENRVRADLRGSFLLDSVTFVATAIAGQPVIVEVEDGFELPETIRVASVVEEISFLVRDQFNHPVPGATVTFATGPNSGTVSPLTAVTDSAGRAETRWTVGTVTGTQTINVAIPGQLPLVLTTTATPDTSRRITVSTGDGQVGATNAVLGAPVQVLVTDRFNNPIADEPVVFNDSIGSGDVMSPPTGTTNANGIASATWRLSSLAGPHQVRVRTPGSGGQTVVFNATGQVRFRDVFAGNFSTCAIGTDDLAYCWGFGGDGQLGTALATSRPAPNWPVTQGDTIAGPNPRFREISGGESHVCGIGLQRTLFCWGFNPDGRTFVTPATGRVLTAVDVSLAPPQTANQVLASTRWIGAGESYSCVITMGGKAFCSGNNEKGQTGSGAATGVPIATAPVDTTTVGLTVAPKDYSFIAVGERHACAMPRFDALVPASQTPWCWGQNNDGQLGDGLATFADSARPGAVNMVAAGVAAFDSTSLVAGAAHTCALTPEVIVGAGGTAYCWGSNAFGQLGDGTATGTGARSSVPVPVAAPAGVMFSRLYAGDYHTCGLTPAGAAFCWGQNTSGQLGNGTVANTNVPVPVSGGLTFRSLAMGELHTCGIVGAGPGPVGTTGTPGDLQCWGDNEYGQLGIGTIGVNALPMLVPTRVVFQQ